MATIALLGASPKKDRYAYKALKALEKHGHEVYLVHPTLSEIEGAQVYPHLSLLPTVDALTLYVNPSLVQENLAAILALKPQVVIFNPGTECPEIYPELNSAQIKVLEACTLVMLSVGNFPV